MWVQKEFKLKPRARGFHLITTEVIQQLPELAPIHVGLLNILIKHTSASLSINENADPTVRKDFENFFNRIAAEDQNYLHDAEGSDDMPAHLKASLLGASLTIPVTNGRLNMGTWQGIYLCEHRNHGGSRTLVLTLQGE